MVGEIWVDAGVVPEGVVEEDVVAGICSMGRSLEFETELKG